jgi:hypothetical protein
MAEDGNPDAQRLLKNLKSMPQDEFDAEFTQLLGSSKGGGSAKGSPKGDAKKGDAPEKAAKGESKKPPSTEQVDEMFNAFSNDKKIRDKDGIVRKADGSAIETDAKGKEINPAVRNAKQLGQKTNTNRQIPNYNNKATDPEASPEEAQKALQKNQALIGLKKQAKVYGVDDVTMLEMSIRKFGNDPQYAILKEIKEDIDASASLDEQAKASDQPKAPKEMKSAKEGIKPVENYPTNPMKFESEYPKEFAARVQELEEEGMDNGDAQGVAMAEVMTGEFSGFFKNKAAAKPKQAQVDDATLTKGQKQQLDLQVEARVDELVEEGFDSDVARENARKEISENYRVNGKAVERQAKASDQPATEPEKYNRNNDERYINAKESVEALIQQNPTQEKAYKKLLKDFEDSPYGNFTEFLEEQMDNAPIDEAYKPASQKIAEYPREERDLINSYRRQGYSDEEAIQEYENDKQTKINEAMSKPLTPQEKSLTGTWQSSGWSKEEEEAIIKKRRLDPDFRPDTEENRQEIERLVGQATKPAATPQATSQADVELADLSGRDKADNYIAKNYANKNSEISKLYDSYSDNTSVDNISLEGFINELDVQIEDYRSENKENEARALENERDKIKNNLRDVNDRGNRQAERDAATPPLATDEATTRDNVKFTKDLVNDTSYGLSFSPVVKNRLNEILDKVTFPSGASAETMVNYLQDQKDRLRISLQDPKNQSPATTELLESLDELISNVREDDTPAGQAVEQAIPSRPISPVIGDFNNLEEVRSFVQSEAESNPVVNAYYDEFQDFYAEEDTNLANFASFLETLETDEENTPERIKEIKDIRSNIDKQTKAAETRLGTAAAEQGTDIYDFARENSNNQTISTYVSEFETYANDGEFTLPKFKEYLEMMSQDQDAPKSQRDDYAEKAALVEAELEFKQSKTVPVDEVRFAVNYLIGNNPDIKQELNTILSFMRDSAKNRSIETANEWFLKNGGEFIDQYSGDPQDKQKMRRAIEELKKELGIK